MAATSGHEDPFVDPVTNSMDRSENGFVVNATLAVGKNASLTLGTDALIVLGMIACGIVSEQSWLTISR